MEGQSLARQLQAQRSAMMVAELEAVALRLFGARGFAEVTVEEIAAAAHISVRTFYRYFPAKEDVLQVRIDRRNDLLRAALDRRPADEPPLRALRTAMTEAVEGDDLDLLRRWTGVVAATSSVLAGVVGGIQLKTHRLIAEFFGRRLDVPADALVPTMLAAAAGGVIQAAHVQWFIRGGDLATGLSDSLEVLEDVVELHAVPKPRGGTAGPARRGPAQPARDGRRPSRR